jgi:hypothetical protein
MDLVCCIKISVSFPLFSDPCMLYHNFYCTFSSYLPLTKPGLRYLYSRSYTHVDCPVIEVSSCWGTQQSRRLFPDLRTETHPVSGNMFCSFLEYRTTDKVQNPRHSKKNYAYIFALKISNLVPKITMILNVDSQMNVESAVAYFTELL